jgi:ELWxxDGT repeat protein
MKPHLLFAFAALLLATSELRAAPYLVKDLGHGLADAANANLFDTEADGAVVYFAGFDPAHGGELWRSDGTAPGTYRVADVCPGRCSAGASQITVLGGKVYFRADDGITGSELWVSDGVPGHERRVKDVCQGPCASTPEAPVAVGDRLVFFAQLGRRRQLWRTDGTTAGTTRLATPCTVPATGGDCISDLTSIGTRAFFGVASSSGGTIWVSDGTAAGTLPLKSAVPNLPDEAFGIVANGSVAFFSTLDALWRTDGTVAGTQRLKGYADLVPGIGSTGPARTAFLGNTLYVVLHSGDFLRSDGTPEGTVALGVNFPFPDGINLFAPLQDRLVFGVDYPSGPSSSALWQTQGTAETTTKIADFVGVAFIDQMAAIGSHAVFRLVYDDRADTVELWGTDGTAAGTGRVTADLGIDGVPKLEGFAAAAGQAFFTQPSPAAPTSSDVDPISSSLWRTDGTAAGTRLVYDFGAGPGSADPFEQIGFGGKLLFSAGREYLTAPLYVSDGTAAGTGLLSAAAVDGHSFLEVGNKVFFAAGDTDNLWRTDGTPAGTVEVSDVRYASSPKRLGQELLFAADSSSGGSGIELYRSDGTAQGTSLVKDINPYLYFAGNQNGCLPLSSSPGPGVVIGKSVLFAADDSVHGRELWTSDGTTRGTRLLADINPLSLPATPGGCGADSPTSGFSSNPDGFARLGAGAVALFAADDGTAGRELWRTDGTPRGTRRIADLLPGPYGSAPHDLTRFSNLIYFFASITGTGDALLRTDGTAQGTVVVSDLKIDGTPTWAKGLIVSGGKLFFSAYNPGTGDELWASDGTSTRIVTDLRPGPGSSTPQNLTDVSGVLLFAADDGTSGLELWRSDGTVAGTRRLADIHPGLDSSSPGPFTIVGDRVFFGADDGVHGRELWAIPVTDVLTP